MAGKTKISQLLKSKGSSQKKAAEVLGITQGAFSLKANGFSEAEIEKLAEHCGVQAKEIMELL